MAEDIKQMMTGEQEVSTAPVVPDHGFGDAPTPAEDNITDHQYDLSTAASEEDDDLGFGEAPAGVENVSKLNPAMPDEVAGFDKEELTDKDVEDVTAGKYDPFFEGQNNPIADMSFMQNIDVNDKDLLTGDVTTTDGYKSAVAYAGAVTDGVWDAGENVMESVATLADSAVNWAYDAEDPEYFLNLAKSVEVQSPELAKALENATNHSAGTAFVKSTSQFLIGFIPIIKGIKVMQGSGKVMPWLKKLAGAGTAGAITDFMVWDYTEKRLADFTDELGSELVTETRQKFLENPEDAGAFDSFKLAVGEAMTSKVIKMLKFDEDDGPLMGRTKQALEGMFAGTIFNALFSTFGLLGRAKAIQKAKDKNPKKDTGKDKKDITKEENVEELTGIKDGDSLIGDIPQVELSPKLQTEFNTIFFQGNKAAAVELLARALKPHMQSIKGLNTIQNFDDIVDQLILNAKAAAREQGTKKAVRAKAGVTSAQAKANPEQVITENEGAIEQLQSLTRDLDTVEFKAGVVDEAMGYRYLEAARAVKAGKMSKEELQELINLGTFLSENIRYGRSDMARAFAMIKESKYVNGKDGKQGLKTSFTNIQKQTREYDKLDDVIEQLAKIDPNGPLPDNIAEIAKGRGWFKKLRSAGAEAFVGSILGVNTFGLQLVSNIGVMLARTADIHASAFRNVAGEAGEKAITHKMAFAHTIGYISAVFDAIKLFSKSYKDETAYFSRNKAFVNEYSPKAAITADELGFRNLEPGSPLHYLNKSINAIGFLFRGLPGGVRSMMASDEAFKYMNHRAHDYSKLMQEVSEEINPVTNPMKFKEQFKKRFAEVTETDKYKAKHGTQADRDNFALYKEGLEEGHVATFTNSWGEKGEGWYRMIRQTPLMVLILPFVRAPVNAALYIGRQTPGLNLTPIGSKISKQLKAGGFEAERAIGHLSMGGALWTAAMLYAFEKGDTIMGAASGKDAMEYRDMGIERTTSIDPETGEKTAYRGLEPHSQMFSLAASLMHQWMGLISKAGDGMTDKQIMQASQHLVWDSTMLVLSDVKDKSAFQGVERALSAVQEGSPLRAEKIFNGYIAGWVSLLSTHVKWLRQRMGEDQIRRAPETLPESIDQRYGGFLSRYGITDRAVPYLNSFGDEVQQAQPNMLGEATGLSDNKYNPLNAIPTSVKTSKGFESEAQKEILRVKQALPNKPVLGTVPKSYKGIKIDNRERYNLLKFMKNFKTVDGLDMDGQFTKLFNSRVYQQTTTAEGKAFLIHDIYDKRRKIAVQLMLLDGYAYENGLARPYAENLELTKYGRGEALAVQAEREAGVEINQIMGKDSKHYMDLGKLQNKGDLQRTKAFRQAQAIFRRMLMQGRGNNINVNKEQ